MHSQTERFQRTFLNFGAIDAAFYLSDCQLCHETGAAWGNYPLNTLLISTFLC